MPRRLSLLTVTMLAFAASAVAPFADAHPAAAAEPPKPKLLVIVSIDQFPTEYLLRFSQHFGPGGFRRMMDSGAFYTECRHQHAFTETGPGHATISTGAWARQHGIAHNSYFDPRAGDTVYCVADPEFPAIPATPGRRDRAKPTMGRSPRNLLADTVGDQLKMATFGKGRVVSVAMKDRAAILMGGQAADEVYWYDESTGKFVTSFYYRSDLAAWVAAYNAQDLAKRAGLTPLPPKAKPADPKAGPDAKDAKDAKEAKPGEPSYEWPLLLDEKLYAHLPENNPKLKVPDGMGVKFPHALPKGAELLKALWTTPFGNEMVLNLAMAAVEGEKLGRGEATDLLCVGFSCNDPVGHAFGPHSREVMDMTLRTDRQIAALLEFLDAKVGADKYAVALTSDHGVTPIHDRAAQAGVSTYRAVPAKLREAGEAALAGAFGPSAKPYIRATDGSTVFLDWSVLAERKVERPRAERVLADALLRESSAGTGGGAGIAAVFTRSELSLLPCGPEAGEEAAVLLARDFHAVRGGDVIVQMLPYTSGGKEADSSAAAEKPAPIERPTGAGHGSLYEADQRVPLIFYGAGIAPGRHRRRCGVVDLAATVCELAGIPRPSACQGRPLPEVFGGK
jgi:arylsulfatase A-like enzyme